MTSFSYDETDDFDDEPQDSLLDEEDADDIDLEDDEEELGDPATALSRAFREAAAVEEVEEDEEDEEDDDEEVEAEAVEEHDDEKVVEASGDEKEDSPKVSDDDDTEAYEQRLAEAIDALSDEEDLEVVAPPLEIPSLDVEFFRPQEQGNLAYADAVKAYYEEKNYQRAIEKFGEAIENETQYTGGDMPDSNSVAAKAMYWQAEAYVKMQDISQAIVTFESLIQKYQEHYLSLAAQRRTVQLNPE